MLSSLPEGVRIMPVTKESLRSLWEKLKNFDKLFSDSSQGDELSFYNRLVNSVVFETEGGIMCVDNLVLNEHAQVHVSFWDRKLSAKTELIKETLKWVFQTYELNRVEALIPAFSHALGRFLVKRMGFTLEGRLRERLLYHGQFNDILIYSLLRKEIENG